MKITIITATYNSELTVADTIESVLNQSYPDIEYLIIDGLSKDRTLEIVRSYEPQFEGRMRVVSERDSGIYDALNKGVAHATGDVIGFIHADDLLADKDVVARVAEAFAQQGCQMVYGDLLYVSHDNDKVVRHWKSAPFTHSLLKKGWMPAHPTLYVDKSVYEQYGLFDTSFRISADYDFILRSFGVIDPLKTVYLPFVMVRMRVGGASNKSIQNIWHKMKEDLRAIKRNKIGNPLLVLYAKNASKITQFIK